MKNDVIINDNYTTEISVKSPKTRPSYYVTMGLLVVIVWIPVLF